jgi:Rieske Fe-S protein
MPLVNVGKVTVFVVNGPPVDITGKFAANAPPRVLTRFADAAGGSPQLSSVSSTCTHMGCPILTGMPQWNTTPQPIYNPATKVITCPCHGSQFNVQTGALVHGVVPGQSSLATFAVQIQGTDVYVDSDPQAAPAGV